MTEQVFGIPSQTIMDMLTLITNEGPSEYAKVIHCKGIVLTAEYDKPCQPVDRDQFPNWECINSVIGNNYNVADSHHQCFKHNAPNALGPNQTPYYCCCKDAPQNKTNHYVYNYAIINRTDPAYCEGCATMHSKTTACPMCGEVHP